MNRYLRIAPASLGLWLLLSASGCSAPAGLHSDESSASQHPVPFQSEAVTAGKSAPMPDGKPVSTAGVPFDDAHSLPAGTMLTVRLKDPISADNPDASGTFAAVVDEPVMVEGSALVPRGANVAGRVESARTSTVKRNRGYIRLTLDSIDLGGRDLAVQTSSLFARGASSEDSSGVIKVEKGRRLTFRLAEPVYIASRQPISSH